MARDYRPWTMSSDVRQGLGEKVSQALYGGIDSGNVGGLIEQFGKPELASRIAGTTDKKSRAYRSARDSLTRWQRGSRRPSKANAAKLDVAAKGEKRAKIRAGGSAAVSMGAAVKTSKSSWTGRMTATLTGSALADFLDATGDGNYELAAQIVSDQYGLNPDYVEGLSGVNSFDLDAPE